MRAHDPGAPPDAAFNFVLATLVSMSDPGLTILPTHRLVHSYSRMTGAELRQALVPYFDVQPVADRAALEAGLAAAVPEHPRFGFYDGGHVLLTLRSLDVMVELVPNRARVWRALDVAILHEIIIHHIMQMTWESVASQEHIRYLRDPGPGYAAVRAGEADFLFVLNPTRVEQVRACAEAGEMMPQKSTDFYPKVIGGLVALPLTGSIGA